MLTGRASCPPPESPGLLSSPSPRLGASLPPSQPGVSLPSCLPPPPETTSGSLPDSEAASPRLLHIR
eukprot:911074-Rhodomonas_salina.3